MKDMNEQKMNTLKYLKLWKGEFAENYQNRPKLYRALLENEVY